MVVFLVASGDFDKPLRRAKPAAKRLRLVWFSIDPKHTR
jgi:hypothetical protein